MDGKILGIPVILIMLVVAIAASVGIPMVLLHKIDQRDALDIKAGLSVLYQQGDVTNQKLDDMIAATKSATIEPTKTPVKVFVPVTTPKPTPTE